MLELDLSIRPQRNQGDSDTAKRPCLEAPCEESVDCPELSYLRDLVDSAFAAADAEAEFASASHPVALPVALPQLQCVDRHAKFSRAGLLSEYGGVREFMRLYCKQAQHC